MISYMKYLLEWRTYIQVRVINIIPLAIIDSIYCNMRQERKYRYYNCNADWPFSRGTLELHTGYTNMSTNRMCNWQIYVPIVNETAYTVCWNAGYMLSRRKQQSNKGKIFCLCWWLDIMFRDRSRQATVYCRPATCTQTSSTTCKKCCMHPRFTSKEVPVDFETSFSHVGNGARFIMFYKYIIF